MTSLPEPGPPEAVVDLLRPGTNAIVPLANGEPVAVLDAVEAAAEAGRLQRVRVHQMHVLHDRGYLDGRYGDDLHHVSYFLSHISRPHFQAGGLDVVPSHFSEVPLLLRHLDSLVVLAACSPPDRHGYVSLGTNADYVAPFIGRVPFFVEANPHMPRTTGRNTIHLSQVAGWCEVERPLVEVVPAAPDEVDARIAAHVAERIEDGACIQAGIGSIPNGVLGALRDRRGLGVHTELISDGVIDLVEQGVVTGVNKTRRPGKVVATFALGSQRLYDFLDGNPSVELLPVDWVNDPRIIAMERNFVSINATVEVDFLGQAASEMINGHLWSGSGGQADFARGALYSPGGQGFLVLPSTAAHGTVSRIVPRLSNGQAVTTLKNTVDKVVTEHGVAELRGRTVRERTHALIAIAAPAFRDDLEREARALGWW
ncbi:MAG TPA: acetyl-CoA hydrolase/transferase C-terminal domain-containing protein [Acidimicrobiales bacterium]|nr:acetyl-CoA hydrolase/transferase C-terminal domain-containing protein [Acidimicrobiales bacterium]